MADSHSLIIETEILQEAAHRYALTPDHFTPLMVDEGTHVYAFDYREQSCILKWMPSWEQTTEEIEASVDWVNYLAEHDMPVARAIPSAGNVLVEVIPVVNGYVSVVAYERALGHRPEGSVFDAALFRRWGAVMGKMHRLAGHYQSVRPSVHIPSWDVSEQLGRAQIPAEQVEVQEKWDTLMQHLHTLPRDGDAYGLIHGDLQANNIVVADDRLTVIDFGACEESWFVRDIAIALYFYLWEPHPGQSNHSFASSVFDIIRPVLGSFW